MPDGTQCYAVVRGGLCLRKHTGWLIHGVPVCTLHQTLDSDGAHVYVDKEAYERDKQSRALSARQPDRQRAANPGVRTRILMRGSTVVHDAPGEADTHEGKSRATIKRAASGSPESESPK